MCGSSIDKTDENEENDKIDNKKTEESPVSEVVPGPEEDIEIEAGDQETQRRPTIANQDLLMIQAETAGEGTNADRSRRAPVQVKTMTKSGSVLGRAGKASGKYKHGIIFRVKMARREAVIFKGRNGRKCTKLK